jgi:hypothetical protein
MNDSGAVTETERLYVRKWTDGGARERGELPAEIVVVEQVTTLRCHEVVTDPERIAELNEAAEAAERDGADG